MAASLLKRGWLLISGVQRTAAFATSSTVMTERQFKYLEVDHPKPFVAHVRLNRPDKRNAINFEMWNELGQAFSSLGEDSDTRAIVMSANGKMFTAGIDLMDLMGQGNTVLSSDGDAARKAKGFYKMIRTLQNGFTEIEKCPKPVICAIHQGCVGAGVDLTSTVDIRLCSKDAWFQVKEVDVGLAADVGTLQRLPKIIGNQSLARELCFTARKFDSEEAERHGFVSKVYPDKESTVVAAVTMAEEIAKKSPVAVQGTKHNIIYSRDHSVDEGLDYIARWNSTMLQSEDLVKSGMAVMSKSEEPPAFSKL